MICCWSMIASILLSIAHLCSCIPRTCADWLFQTAFGRWQSEGLVCVIPLTRFCHPRVADNRKARWTEFRNPGKRHSVLQDHWQPWQQQRDQMEMFKATDSKWRLKIAGKDSVLNAELRLQDRDVASQLNKCPVHPACQRKPPVNLLAF